MTPQRKLYRTTSILGALVALVLAATVAPAATAQAFEQSRPPPDLDFSVAYDIDDTGEFSTFTFSPGGVCSHNHDVATTDLLRSSALAVQPVRAGNVATTSIANVNCKIFDVPDTPQGRWVPVCLVAIVEIRVPGIGAAAGYASCNLLTGPTAACVAVGPIPGYCTAVAVGATTAATACYGVGVATSPGWSQACHFYITWVWVPY